MEGVEAELKHYPGSSKTKGSFLRLTSAYSGGMALVFSLYYWCFDSVQSDAVGYFISAIIILIFDVANSVFMYHHTKLRQQEIVSRVMFFCEKVKKYGIEHNLVNSNIKGLESQHSQSTDNFVM